MDLHLKIVRYDRLLGTLLAFEGVAYIHTEFKNYYLVRVTKEITGYKQHHAPNFSLSALFKDLPGAKHWSKGYWQCPGGALELIGDVPKGYLP